MKNTPEDYAPRYAAMGEPELMELAQSYDSLVEVAQAALRAEFARRNLEPPVVEEPMQAGSRDLVTVGRYRDLPNADLARALLESSGIPAFIQDDNLVRMDWFYSNAIGGIRLQVEAANADAAREILDQPAPDAISFEDGAEFVQPQCPRCGSADTSLLGSNNELSLSGVDLPFVSLPAGAEGWVCHACGTCWESTDEAPPDATAPNS
jgi:hypothetical protein